MAQQNHAEMLNALGEEQKLAVMEGNIGKCVDYLVVRPGQQDELVVGDVIVGVFQNGLKRGDHRYKVMHKQQEEILFPMWITKGPYDCNEAAGKGGRRKLKTKKRKTKQTRRRSSRRSLRSKSRNHRGW